MFAAKTGALETVTCGVAALSLLGVCNWGIGDITNSFYGPDEARDFATNSGYTNVYVRSVDKLLVGLKGCDLLDSVKYEMTATNTNGAETSIVVCKGLFQAATVDMA